MHAGTAIGEHLVGRLVCIPFHAPCFLYLILPIDRYRVDSFFLLDLQYISALRRLFFFLGRQSKKEFPHSGEIRRISRRSILIYETSLGEATYHFN